MVFVGLGDFEILRTPGLWPVGPFVAGAVSAMVFGVGTVLIIAEWGIVGIGGRAKTR